MEQTKFLCVCLKKLGEVTDLSNEQVGILTKELFI